MKRWVLTNHTQPKTINSYSFNCCTNLAQSSHLFLQKINGSCLPIVDLVAREHRRVQVHLQLGLHVFLVHVGQNPDHGLYQEDQEQQEDVLETIRCRNPIKSSLATTYENQYRTVLAANPAATQHCDQQDEAPCCEEEVRQDGVGYRGQEGDVLVSVCQGPYCHAKYTDSSNL